MQKTSGKRKWSALKTQLAERIVSGGFEFGQRFPGLRQISDEYHVSYLTAVKAQKALESEGYLLCRNGVGHFVSYVAAETALPQKTVQFIMSWREYRERKDFFLAGAELFRAHGWRVRILQCPAGDRASVIEKINSPDVYSIICGLSVPWEHFRASFEHMAKRVLILGSLAGNARITSIISDEYETIRRAMAHFEKLGRKRVAVIASCPTRELEALRLGAWRSIVRESGLSPEWITRHSFSWSGDKPAYSWEQEYPRFLEWLKSIREDTDGLIVPVRHAAVLKGCLLCGFRIPQELAVLLIARSTPELDCEVLPDADVLDHNYAGHFQCALEILEERFRSGKNAAGYWYFCPPGTIQKCRKENK